MLPDKKIAMNSKSRVGKYLKFRGNLIFDKNISPETTGKIASLSTQLYLPPPPKWDTDVKLVKDFAHKCQNSTLIQT